MESAKLVGVKAAVLASQNSSASVISQFAGSPGTDMTDSHSKSMRLVGYNRLYFLASPQFQPLLFRPPGVAVSVQVLKNNHVSVVKNGYIHDVICRFCCNILVDTLCSGPESWRFVVTMPLCFFDTIDAMRQMVCFFGKFTEMSSKNSAIATHYTDRSGCVDA